MEETNEILEYINSYFNGELSSSEKLEFDQRCESDEVFAKEVAFYISARAVVETESDRRMKKKFDELFKEHNNKETPRIRKILPYASIAAAASIVLFIGWFYFYKTTSPNQLAENYINEHLLNIGTTLAATPDSIDLGKSAFNKKNYQQAEEIFNNLSTGPNKNFEAVEYLGITYLVTGNYNKALVQFGTLSGDSTSHSNFGPFYEAITLMRRNNKCDPEKAKILLTGIIDKNLPGNEEAKRWIKPLTKAIDKNPCN